MSRCLSILLGDSEVTFQQKSRRNICLAVLLLLAAPGMILILVTVSRAFNGL
jgi:hypothetical protein